MLDAFNALLCAVPRVYHREESRHEASSKEGTPATQGQREMSGSLQHGADPSCSLDPLISLMSPARLLARRPVSERPSAGVSRLQRGLCHEEEVPSVSAQAEAIGLLILSLPTRDARDGLDTTSLPALLFDLDH